MVSLVLPPKILPQVGIGNIPNAVLGNLKNHRHLGVHTEMFSDGWFCRLFVVVLVFCVCLVLVLVNSVEGVCL